LPGGRLADAHTYYTGAETATITGLDHLEGETVVAWGWNSINPFYRALPNGELVTVGIDLGEFTVSGGSITLPDSTVTDACVGLGYTAQFKSAKLAFAALLGSALNQRGRQIQLGVILQNTHHQGLQYGQDFDHLDDLPAVVDEYDVSSGLVWESLDETMFEFNGTHDTDPRLCLQATAPRPCTVIAATIPLTRSEKP
jgi:hypothetical protein